MERALNPAMLLAFFYTLWMLIPQIFVLMPEHSIVGMEHVPAYERVQATLRTQAYLTLFLSALFIGYAVALGLIRREPGPEFQAPPLQPTRWHYGLAAYAIGVVAFFILGRTFHELPDGTMRSALVKTTSGQVLMTLSFFGSFGVAYLGAHLWLQGRRLLPLILFVVYSYLVLQLGARGRILWPLVTAILFVWGRGTHIRLLPVVVFGVIGLAVLSLMDPLVYGLRNEDYTRFFEALSPVVMFETLFYGRNFDGFGNLLFITHNDLIREQPGFLLGGARDAYMNTYYPAIYEMGVAFPTTVPGEFWLAGKTPLLAAMSAIYGFGLGMMQQYLRSARREAHIWLYLLLLPWLTAVGGELAESVNKMIAAGAPAILWIGAGWLLHQQAPSSTATKFNTARS
tara:strand:- start:39363 stop:40559 length:1197 start_codon:yes stop_codon:yes gene_type:complete